MNEQQQQQETNLTVQKAEALIITNNADYEAAGTALVEIKTYNKRVQDYWKEPKDNAYKAWKGICAKEKVILDPLNEAEGLIKQKMATYQREQEAKERAIRAELERCQREEAERLLKEAEEKEAAGDMLGADLAMTQAELVESASPVAVMQTAKAFGISSKKVWKARVTDESKVPVDVLGIIIRPVDMSALDKLAKLTDGKGQIPGVEFYQDIVMSARGK
jgi:hypothetical protein